MMHYFKNFTGIKGYFSRNNLALKINILLFILLCGVVVSGYISIDQLRIFKGDALTINNWGIVRGSIQRISKLELTKIHTAQLIKNVDKILIAEKNGDFIKQFYSSSLLKKKMKNDIDRLEKSWEDLKILFTKYRSNQSYKGELIRQSEKCWINANNVVFDAQELSEEKQKKYKDNLFTLIIFVIIFILGIIYTVYIIVHKNLEVNVITDALTQLFNRDYFDRILHKQEKYCTRNKSTFSLLLCDVDFFKRINDEFGHQQGDRVLIQLSRLLKNNSREYDYIFRYGGEEFALVLPQTTLAQAMEVAEKYRNLVAKEDFGLGKSLTVSTGVSEFSQDENVEHLFKRTDNALYQAKSSGRNKVKPATPFISVPTKITD